MIYIEYFIYLNKIFIKNPTSLWKIYEEYGKKHDIRIKVTL